MSPFMFPFTVLLKNKLASRLWRTPVVVFCPLVYFTGAPSTLRVDTSKRRASLGQPRTDSAAACVVLRNYWSGTRLAASVHTNMAR